MVRGHYVRDGRAVSEPGVQELWIAMWLKLFIEFSSNFMMEFIGKVNLLYRNSVKYIVMESNKGRNQYHMYT